MDTREERKKQIKKRLNSMKAAEVKMYHFLLRKTFLSNQDFRIAADRSIGVYPLLLQRRTEFTICVT